MAKQKQSFGDLLNEHFREALPKAFLEKFGVEIETGYNFFANTVYSARIDGEDFTPEQAAFVSAYEAGYGEAMDFVRSHE